VLDSEGIVLFNDALAAFGFPPVDYGCVCGWSRFKDKNVKISVGVFDNPHPDAGVVEFINGINDSVWLRFNVQGFVYDDFKLLDGIRKKFNRSR
jgi:hypothetical protein